MSSQARFGRFDVYCDESGHSGGNDWDTQQPIYVLAGWAAQSAELSKAESCVLTCKTSSGSRASELKASRLLRTGRGQRAIADLTTCLCHHGCLPLFVIAEKKYVVAGRMVETFLDPFDNPRAEPQLSWDNNLKQDIANTLYRLPEALLAEYAVAHRYPSTDGLRKVVKDVSNCLAEMGERQLSQNVLGVTPKISKIAQLLASTRDTMPINVPVFVAFITMVELLGRWPGVGPTTLFHDKTLEFESTYAMLLAQFRDAEEFDAMLPSGAIMTTGFESLSGFSSVRSEDCLMVQAADLLAGSLSAFVAAVTSGIRPPEPIIRHISLDLMSFFQDKPKLCTVIASNDFLRRLFTFVLAQFPAEAANPPSG